MEPIRELACTLAHDGMDTDNDAAAATAKSQVRYHPYVEAQNRFNVSTRHHDLCFLKISKAPCKRSVLASLPRIWLSFRHTSCGVESTCHEFASVSGDHGVSLLSKCEFMSITPAGMGWQVLQSLHTCIFARRYRAMAYILVLCCCLHTVLFPDLCSAAVYYSLLFELCSRLRQLALSL